MEYTASKTNPSVLAVKSTLTPDFTVDIPHDVLAVEKIDNVSSDQVWYTHNIVDEMYKLPYPVVTMSSSNSGRSSRFHLNYCKDICIGARWAAKEGDDPTTLRVYVDEKNQFLFPYDPSIDANTNSDYIVLSQKYHTINGRILNTFFIKTSLHRPAIYIG